MTTAACSQDSAGAWPRRVGSLLLVLAGSGCALLPLPPMPSLPDRTDAAPELRACVDWYAALDLETQAAGVRDAGASRVAGFPHLRVDRFTASLRDMLAPGAVDSDSDFASVSNRASGRAALLQRLLQLDLQARGFELANLPAPARLRLAAGSGPARRDDADLMQRTRDCAARLGAFDLAAPSRLASVLARLEVPDNYATSYRIFGLYGLSRLPFTSGIRRFEADRRAVFASEAAKDPPATSRLRLAPPTRPPPGTITAARLSRMLAPPATDPLQVPAPSADELALLFAHFAPTFDIDIAGPDDQPGALVWRPAAVADASAGAAQTLEVDSAVPVLYRQLAYTRYGAHNLLQLVYTLWFPARTAAPDKTLDWLAGKLDGLVFRVTLAPDGTPLVYDSIHPCGCYHMFFPTPAARAKPAPEAGIEWAFSPQSLPSLGLEDQLVLRVAARTHYLERLSVAPADPLDGATRYAWRDYNSLRSLPASALTQRSVFGPDGFVAHTDRPESWLFWPMGIARAGAMRQWGHHATAFVGRRHFDDARLMQQRFEFDPAHFAPENPVQPDG